MQLDWERIKAICFDIDGTLSDTDDHLVEHIIDVLNIGNHFIKKDTRKRLARRIVMAVETPGNFLYHLADNIGLDRPVIGLSEWLNRNMPKRKQDHFWIVRGVKKTIQVLADRYPLAVVSARSRTSTETFLEQFELKGFFHAIATSQTCRYTKPYPDPILWSARQMRVAPENCLMVGDTVVDIKAGQAAGAQTAGVLCGFGTRRELERAGADVILKTTSDLIRLIDNSSVSQKGLSI